MYYNDQYLQYTFNYRTVPFPSPHLDNSLTEKCSPIVSHQPCKAHAMPLTRAATPLTPRHLTAHTASTRRRHGSIFFPASTKAD